MTKNELLEELTKLISLPEIEPDEITSQMLSQSTGISERAALTRLHRLEQQGKLSARWVRAESGNKMWAFKKR